MTKRIWVPRSANFRSVVARVLESAGAGGSSTHCAGCTHSLWPAESDTGDALDVLQTELADSLACLLLVARVHRDGGACGDASLGLALNFGVRVRLCILDLDVLLLNLVREFLNAWVGHVDGDVCGSFGGIANWARLVVSGAVLLKRKLLRSRSRSWARPHESAD
jgi:hypothetical protein